MVINIYVHAFEKTLILPLLYNYFSTEYSVNTRINEHLRLMNEYCYKIMFAERLIPRAAKMICIRS